MKRRRIQLSPNATATVSPKASRKTIETLRGMAVLMTPREPTPTTNFDAWKAREIERLMEKED